MNDFKLMQSEVETPLWQKVEKFVNDRLSLARKENDHMLFEQRTNHLRGKIAAYKEILEIGVRDEDI